MAEEDTAPPVEDTGLDDLDPEDGPDEDPPADEDPAAVTKERDTLRTTLAKVKEERAQARKDLKAERAKNAGGEGPKDEPKTDPDLRAKRMAGVAALTAEGLSKDQAKAAVRLLDLDDVELDDDGDADLEDQVEALKSKFPNLFAKDAGPGKNRAPRVNTNPVTSKQKPTGVKRDKTSEALLRQAGYLAR